MPPPPSPTHTLHHLPPQISDLDMHYGTCLTHVPWCIPGSLTSGFLWSRWRGKRSQHSRRLRNPQFISSKITQWGFDFIVKYENGLVPDRHHYRLSMKPALVYSNVICVTKSQGVVYVYIWHPCPTITPYVGLCYNLADCINYWTWACGHNSINVTHRNTVFVINNENLLAFYQYTVHTG